MSALTLLTRWDLLERVRYSLELYPEASVNAFNLWATPLVGNRSRTRSRSSAWPSAPGGWPCSELRTS